MADRSKYNCGLFVSVIFAMLLHAVVEPMTSMYCKVYVWLTVPVMVIVGVMNIPSVGKILKVAGELVVDPIELLTTTEYWPDCEF